MTHTPDSGDSEPPRPSVTVHHDFTSDNSVTATVLDTLLGIDGIPNRARSQNLFDVIDTDSLDKLFQPTSSVTGTRNGWLKFTYLDYEIMVAASGEITITPGPRIDPSDEEDEEE